MVLLCPGLVAIYKISGCPELWASLCLDHTSLIWVCVCECVLCGMCLSPRVYYFLVCSKVLCIQEEDMMKCHHMAGSACCVSCAPPLPTSLERREQEPPHLAIWAVSSWLETICEVSQIHRENKSVGTENQFNWLFGIVKRKQPVV